MNRTIKFRAKRKGAPHEWLIGDLAHIEDKVYIFDRGNNAPLNSPDWYEVIPETVGQFTGLSDKNGKDIYEGGIVKMHQFLFDGSEIEQEHVGLVEYKDETASFNFTRIKGEFYSKHTGYDNGEDADGCPISMFIGLHEESFEIIGNIHENTELLK